MSTFGERLREYAKARFGSLKGLAEEAGVEYTQMTKYASGDQKPRLDVVEKIVSTGVNGHWLLTGQGEMNAPEGDDQLLRPASERLAAIHEHIRKYLEEAEKLREEIGSGSQGRKRRNKSE